MFNFLVSITTGTTAKMSWFVIAIINQGTNKWIDLINVLLLNDAANTLKTNDAGLRNLNLDFHFGQLTIFLAGMHLFIVRNYWTYGSCFYIIVYGRCN